jgi:hypothetical protein
VPMTAAMRLQHRFLPVHEKYSLPPRKITMRMAKKFRSGQLLLRLRPKRQRRLSLLSHFGYGAAVGAPYTALTDRLPGKPVYKGMAYGLLVWTVSYLGWLPATGLWKPKEESAKRKGLMIASHLIWGGFLGALSPSTFRLLQRASEIEENM